MKEYQVWTNYGVEGWDYEEFANLKDAIISKKNSQNWLITKKVDYEITEVKETEYKKCIHGVEIIQEVQDCAECFREYNNAAIANEQKCPHGKQFKSGSKDCMECYKFTDINN